MIELRAGGMPPDARAPSRSQAAVKAWAAPLRARWAALAPRERQALAAAALVLGLFVAWSVAVAPAWRTLRSAPVELDRLDMQLQQMQRQAAEVQELRSTPTVAPTQAVAALRAASSRLGDKAQLTLAGDRATLKFSALEGAQLRDWLAEARSGARARPIEAQFTRSAQGYGGSIVVSLSAAGLSS